MDKPLGYAKCERCNNQVPYFTRDEFEFMIDYPPLCSRCIQAEQDGVDFENWFNQTRD